MTTGLLDTEPAGTESSQRMTTPRDMWRRARLPVVIGAMIAAVAILQAVTSGSVGGAEYLDPQATRPPGARALVELLRDHGVDVRVVEAPSSAPDTTVFLARPALLPEGTLAGLTAREIVVATPRRDDAGSLGIDVEASGEVDARVVDPGCTQQDAVAAGDVYLGRIGFAAPEDAVTCYAVDGLATFVELNDRGRRVTVLGTGEFMTNERLADNGNAALALRLLARNPTLEWVFPTTLPPAEEEGDTLGELLPDRVYTVVWQLLVVVLLAALWRMRRLGPVVTEPLPVVVRAAEAVEGRARLYEASASRGRAADALRAGLRDRLVRTLGLAPDAGRETLVAAVTARTTTFDGYTVDALLYGPPPVDDAALVRLAADLDSLDSEVRSL